jgi:predicted house-cleaning noncanonical NTP pyrophosphatase (MazG superfamily)
MKYNKLVRDKIPDYIRKKGDTPITHIANEAEYWQKLKEKLTEEIEEFNKDENAEEYADILEVIEAIADYKKFNKEEVQRIKLKKVEERGGFKDKIILDES